MSEATYLPNGSYFYNVDTRRIHAGNFDDSGALVLPAGKEKSPLTFNLVPKEYPTDDRPLMEPTKYYSVLEFPTTQSTVHLLSLVKAAVTSLSTVKVFGKTVAPRGLSDSPNFVVLGSEGDEVILDARSVAYEAVEKGDAAATEWVKIALQGQGSF
jgi:hypothetical protein